MHGFRPRRCTETALCELLEDIKVEKSKKNKVAILALDCSAAFDIINHKLILASLKHMGAGPKMLNWTDSCMPDCKYSVKIGNDYSKIWEPAFGVGQGRCYSPTLFNIGCLSMPIWETIGKSILHADDGCTLISGKTISDLNQKIYDACVAKCDWYTSAGFVINGLKSELMGIGCTPNTVSVAGHEVVNKDSIKFLGLTISSDMK